MHRAVLPSDATQSHPTERQPKPVQFTPSSPKESDTTPGCSSTAMEVQAKARGRSALDQNAIAGPYYQA